MKHYILRNVFSLFNETTTQSIASRLAERHTNVIDALERIIPDILRGFASKSQEGPETANALLQLASEANNYNWWQKALNWITDEDKMQKGHEMLQQIFGNNNIDRIGEQIAQKTMIRRSSTVKLMQWAAPLCLGVIGKEVAEKNYDAAMLAAWLSKEPFDIDGDGLAGGIKTTKVPAYARYTAGTKPVKEKKDLLSWLPLLLLLLFAAFLWWFFKERPGDTIAKENVIAQDVAPAKTSNDMSVSYASLPAYTVSEDSTVNFKYEKNIPVKLPNGSELNIAANSAEALLLASIQDAMDNGLNDTEESEMQGWINLYDVQFVKGTDYREGARQQLENISAILKAFPSVKIRIGGYTDNTGSDEINAKISQDRADKVMQELQSMDIKAQVVKAEGYGPQYPIADNNTREGRALNRRVSCRIVSIN